MAAQLVWAMETGGRGSAWSQRRRRQWQAVAILAREQGSLSIYRRVRESGEGAGASLAAKYGGRQGLARRVARAQHAGHPCAACRARVRPGRPGFEKPGARGRIWVGAQPRGRDRCRQRRTVPSWAGRRKQREEKDGLKGIFVIKSKCVFLCKLIFSPIS